jgi:hypothetical protein
MTPLVMNILFGLILGAVWGTVCGVARGKAAFAEIGSNMILRNALGGILGYVVAMLILGTAAAQEFGYIGLCFGIVPMVILENYLRKRLSR